MPTTDHTVRNVIATLGRYDVTAVTDVSERTVTRWATGETRPSPHKVERLLELHYIAELASEVFTPEGVGIWLHSPQRWLEGAKPIDRIRDGEYKQLADALEAMADGAFV